MDRFFDPDRRFRTIPMKRYLTLILLLTLSVVGVTAQSADPKPPQTEKAEAVIALAVEKLGGNRYLGVTTQIGRGKFSVIREGSVVSFQTFLDIIVFPDRERTEFRGNGNRIVQVNTGDTGWIFNAELETLRDQNETQVEAFKRGIRTSLDNLLRGGWKGSAVLSYVGRRPATLGKRNEVIKLKYNDDFEIEFEFSADDGLPQKSIHKRESADGEPIIEEDRYAQFIEVNGIRSPFIIDRFTGGKQSSRINYESIDFNKRIPDTIFTKPANIKEAKKEIKL